MPGRTVSEVVLKSETEHTDDDQTPRRHMDHSAQDPGVRVRIRAGVDRHRRNLIGMCTYIIQLRCISLNAWAILLKASATQSIVV